MSMADGGGGGKAGGATRRCWCLNLESGGGGARPLEMDVEGWDMLNNAVDLAGRRARALSRRVLR